jgi:hypothetical protein
VSVIADLLDGKGFKMAANIAVLACLTNVVPLTNYTYVGKCNTLPAANRQCICFMLPETIATEGEEDVERHLKENL